MVEETKLSEEGITFQSSKWHVQTSAGRKTKVTGRRSVCLDGGGGGGSREMISTAIFPGAKLEVLQIHRYRRPMGKKKKKKRKETARVTCNLCKPSALGQSLSPRK